MERKIGKLGLKPIEALGFGHSGNPGENGGPEYYLGNKLNLNIVYSVYHESKTLVQIAEELGITPVFIEDSVKELEENGFLVKQAGNRYTTYVRFDPETFSLEQRDRRLRKQMEIAELLYQTYVPAVRAAIADVQDVYIPSGNRELLEAAAIFYAISNKCDISVKRDLSSYHIKTKAGGEFIAFVHTPAVQRDPDYVSQHTYPTYWACGDMTRWSDKYPSVYAWAIDTRYSSREGGWENNHTSDYEFLYEVMTGAIENTPANLEKYARLKKRGYLTEDNRVNIMVVRGDQKAFFSNLPLLDEALKKKIADDVLEQAMLAAEDYPPQMRDLAVNWSTGGFIGNTVSLMVMDMLYQNGIFRPLSEAERITANLLMFSDILPK